MTQTEKISSHLLMIFIIFLSNMPSRDIFAQGPSLNRSQLKAPRVIYSYKDREHTTKEDLAHLGILYGGSWFVYYLTQRKTLKEEGSFKKFRHNLGHVVFDKDEPIWNWVGHPYTGSQVYLFYRARGYPRLHAFKMAFFQSALFEFTIETYTEPASIQDLYQTPVLGSALGLVLEHLSLYLLNREFFMARILGHILNPSTLFWFYEGKVQVYPQIQSKKIGMTLYVSF